jgi:secreted protein acidic and rich in cysteine
VFNERKELDLTKYGNLISLANQMKKDKIDKYWTCGVAFEFCQLDKSQDGIIESNEIRELIAPLKALEHCIQPFLNDCDKDKDGQILDAEWAECLDLSKDDLLLLRGVCNKQKIN